MKSTVYERKIMCVTTVDLSLRFLVLESLLHQQSKGYDVIGVCAPGQYVAEVEAVGVPVRQVRMTRRITPIDDAIALGELVRLFVHERPAIVHTHTPKANLLGQLAAKFAGVPVRVSTVHGLYFTPMSAQWNKALFRFTESLSARYADTVFLTNQDDVSTATELGICRREQIRLLPGDVGIDLTKFSPGLTDGAALGRMRQALGLPPDALTIGFVGRLVREKGLIELFRAFRQILDHVPNAWLLVVGPYDGDKPDAISPKVAEEHGIASRSIFTGRRSDTVDLYGLMDIFVLPSYREGLPLSVMEAQAMGLPVVTTNARGCREAIVPGQTGMMVPVRDSEALVVALLSLAQNAGLRRAMGEAGRRLAQQRFDQRLAFEIVEHEYARLLKRWASR